MADDIIPLRRSYVLSMVERISELEAENERLRAADNLLNRAERLIAAGDKLAQGVLDEHQPFPNDQHINLWWLVANWQEARREQ